MDSIRKVTAAVNDLLSHDSLRFNKPVSQTAPVLKADSIVKNSSLQQKFKNFVPYGSVSFGADYGFLPYTVNTSIPSSAFNTQGHVGLNLFSMPADLTFFYSTQKNLIGLNNYFRISYNADRYKDKLNAKLDRDAFDLKQQLGPLYAKRQVLTQKMAYIDYLSHIDPAKWPVDKSLPAFKELNSDPRAQLDSTAAVIPTVPSLQIAAPVDTLSKYSNANLDSLSRDHKLDSLKSVYYNYKLVYDSINNSVQKINRGIAALDDVTKSNYKAYSKNSSLLSGSQNILSGLQKFEIGLCYPSHSTFLVANVPVRGINFEYAKNNWYLAFTYGTTVSTLLYNNGSPDGFLQNVRNSYNYFDFNNIAEGRKILALKFGAGPKDGSHIYAGALIGHGRQSYVYSETTGGIKKESNLVLELDARYKLNAATALDFVIGKSSVMDGSLHYEEIKHSLSEIFSRFRSYAALSRISTRIVATKTSLSASVRWVDPFFKSYGIGFIRSDNMRCELKIDQQIISRLKYSGMFRYEEDNLLSLMNYKNRFYSLNNTLSFKVRRGLMLRAGYTPLWRDLNSDGKSYKTNNSISTAVVSYNTRVRKSSLQINALYSYYIVNTDSQQVNFENFAYTQQLSYKNGFKTSLNVSWYKNSLRDSVNNNVFMGVVDVGYKFKNGSSVTLAGKSAYKFNDKLYPGFIAVVDVKLFRGFFWQSHIEKFIVGDLFNAFNSAQLQQFPYYCNTKLVYNF